MSSDYVALQWNSPHGPAGTASNPITGIFSNTVSLTSCGTYPTSISGTIPVAWQLSDGTRVPLMALPTLSNDCSGSQVVPATGGILSPINDANLNSVTINITAVSHTISNQGQIQTVVGATVTVHFGTVGQNSTAVPTMSFTMSSLQCGVTAKTLTYQATDTSHSMIDAQFVWATDGSNNLSPVVTFNSSSLLTPSTPTTPTTPNAPPSTPNSAPASEKSFWDTYQAFFYGAAGALVFILLLRVLTKPRYTGYGY